MTDLKPCPFCGREAEMQHGTFYSKFTDNRDEIPKDAKIIRDYRGHVEYREVCFIPRCKDKSCIGRLGKRFASEREAIVAWNRRVSDEAD